MLLPFCQTNTLTGNENNNLAFKPPRMRISVSYLNYKLMNTTMGFSSRGLFIVRKMLLLLLLFSSTYANIG